MIQNKKANVPSAVIFWIFSVFFYFTIGIKVVGPIVEALNTYEGILGFFSGIIPFIPVLGLMWWGYTIITPPTEEI